MRAQIHETSTYYDTNVHDAVHAGGNKIRELLVSNCIVTSSISFELSLRIVGVDQIFKDIARFDQDPAIGKSELRCLPQRMSLAKLRRCASFDTFVQFKVVLNSKLLQKPQNSLRC